MPRDSANVFSTGQSPAAPNTTIESAFFNAVVQSIVDDLNDERPISVGGTGGATAAAARENLGVAQAQDSTNDATPGRGLTVGAFGLGGNAPVEADWDAITRTKFLRTGATSTNGTPTTHNSYVGLHIQYESSAAQIAFNFATSRTYVRFRQSSTWSSWREIYHAGSILGTVSMSSSVPAGAIFEQGTHATRGKFIRYASGWQECTLRGAALTASTAAGNVFRSDAEDWTYPAAFAEAPVISLGVERVSGGFPWAGGSGSDTAVSATLASAILFGATVNTVGRLHWTARGRWIV